MKEALARVGFCALLFVTTQPGIGATPSTLSAGSAAPPSTIVTSAPPPAATSARGDAGFSEIVWAQVAAPKQSGEKPTIEIDPHATVTENPLLAQAIEMVKAGQTENAITGPVDTIINAYNTHFPESPGAIYYSARSADEALLYAAMAAKSHLAGTVLGPTWEQAYFIKGSALNSLARYQDARAPLTHALALAPMNAQTIMELAYSDEKLNQLEKALQLCESAEAYTAFSPNKLQAIEKARALRCEGYNLGGLHRYAQARDKYEAALKINPSDSISKHELRWIAAQAGGG